MRASAVSTDTQILTRHRGRRASPISRTRRPPDHHVRLRRRMVGRLMQVLSVRGAQESASGLSAVVQTHGGGGLAGHRVLRTADSETFFTWCARPKLGLRGTRNPPPQSRLRARNLAAAWLLLAREVPRSTAASARRSECDSAAAVVGSDWRWR